MGMCKSFFCQWLRQQKYLDILVNPKEKRLKIIGNDIYHRIRLLEWMILGIFLIRKLIVYIDLLSIKFKELK